MRVQKTLSRFAVVAAFALAFSAPGEAAQVTGAGESSGFVDLSEDSGSGAGFYPLPKQYRAGARRARAGAAIDSEEAIGAAIASTAVEDEFDEGYVFGNSHSVFNPVDGVGTPFFGGYYGR
jgi:hypothetical protein